MVDARILRPGHMDGLGNAILSATGMIPRDEIAITTIGAGLEVKSPVLEVVGFTTFLLIFSSTLAGGAITWYHVDPRDGTTELVGRNIGTIAAGTNTIPFGAGSSLIFGDVFTYGKLGLTAAGIGITVGIQNFTMGVR